MRISEAISKTANSVGDIGYDAITKKEYIDIFNDTMDEIVKDCGTIYEIEEITPTEGSNSIELTDSHHIVRLEYKRGDGPYFPCREVALGRVMDVGLMNEGGATVSDEPVRFYGENGATVMELPPDPGTKYDVYTLNWYATKVDNGKITIYFGFKFNKDDKIKIQKHLDWVKKDNYDDTENIWEGYTQTLLEGMRWRALRLLMYRNSPNQRQLWEYRNEANESRTLYYSHLMPKLKRYIWNLKTIQDEVRIAPFKYL